MKRTNSHGRILNLIFPNNVVHVNSCDRPLVPEEPLKKQKLCVNYCGICSFAHN